MDALQAIIFDMDGVLIDSEFAYMQAIINYLHDRGYDLPPDEFSTVVGKPTDEYVAAISDWFDRAPGRTQEEIERGAVACVFDALDKAIADPIPYRAPHLPELLQKLHDCGLRLAIASSSTSAEIEEITAGMGVYEMFDIVVSCDDVEHAKPAPDIYLLVLERLGIGPDHAIAVEDSDTGIAAALAAGLPVIIKRDGRFGAKQLDGTWYVDQIRDIPSVLGLE